MNAAVLHAFFGAFISVLGARLLDPLLFDSLGTVTLVAYLLALAFLFLELALSKGAMLDKIGYLILGLFFVGVILPLVLSWANQDPDLRDKFTTSEKYVFLILFSLYSIFLWGYNSLRRG
jgi:hypothetical protein